MKLMLYKSHVFQGFMWLNPNTCCVGGKVAAGSRSQTEEPPSLHHRVMSGTSCQDRHSPEAQAKVKIKSLVESRRVGLTQQVTP